MLFFFRPQNRDTLKTLVEVTLLMLFLPIIGYKLSYAFAVKCTFCQKFLSHVIYPTLEIILRSESNMATLPTCNCGCGSC